MIRRTRSEIEKYYVDDMKKIILYFLKYKNHYQLYYLLNETEDEIFDKTLRAITTDFKYARYTPLYI